MKTTAKSVLLIWLASWMLAILQPCCEAVAESLPHKHGHDHQSVSHEHTAPAHHDHHPDTLQHAHCETDVVKLVDIAVPPATSQLTAEIFNNSLDHDTEQLALLTDFELPAREREFSSFHPPPSEQIYPIYLVTQRLRI